MKVKMYRFRIEKYDASGDFVSKGVDSVQDIQEEIDYFLDMHVREIINLTVSTVPILYPAGGTMEVFLYYTITYIERR